MEMKIYAGNIMQQSLIFLFISVTIISCSPKLQLNKTLTEDDKKFKTFWLSLSDSLKSSKVNCLKNISLDSLWACDSLYSSETFFQKCYSTVFDEKRIELLSDTTQINYTWTEAIPSFFPLYVRQKLNSNAKRFRIRQVEISKIKQGLVHVLASVDFVETTDGYKFYSVSFHKQQICCR